MRVAHWSDGLSLDELDEFVKWLLENWERKFAAERGAPARRVRDERESTRASFGPAGRAAMRGRPARPGFRRG